jgi:hypothetical protein
MEELPHIGRALEETFQTNKSSLLESNRIDRSCSRCPGENSRSVFPSSIQAEDAIRREQMATKEYLIDRAADRVHEWAVSIMGLRNSSSIA